jgi:pilus assembly protein FimV
LRAEIELLATTPEELNNLTVALASVETFERYDLDRPLFLSRLNFEVVRSGRADGNFIRITSANAISEPFVTLIVEAVWSRGRLLREYTVLLDPPTFAPPPATQASQEVIAPSRAAPADSGEIQRPPAQQPAAPAPQPRPAVQAPARSAPAEPEPSPSAIGPEPSPAPSAIGPEPTPRQPAEQDPGSFDTTSGGDLVVQRGDTLWGISRRMRPDSRLTMNQTMLAIYEANPEAFVGNINRLRAGAVLRIPSADDVFRITRTDAFAEVKRQNEAWGGMPGPSVPAPTTDVAPVVDTQPNLTLVPPDDDVSLTDTSVTSGTPDTDLDALPVDPDEARIEELEALFADQDSLIEIEDNELAALRAELAALRGEELPPVEDVLEDPVLDDELPADDIDSLLPDDALVDDAADDTQVVAPPVVSAPVRDEPGLVDVIMGYLTNFWVIIGLALAAAIALLAWFMRRSANDDEEATGVWETIDVVDSDEETLAATSSLTAMAQPDETTILVEEARAPRPAETPVSDTIEAPAAPEPEAPQSADLLAETGMNQTLEDTFSSETAINLDQTDPVAEADFHMAYGLYDQAADLINGALATDPGREDLLAKLCEIYFVWGNRDAFIDAAGRMTAAVGSDSNAEWDKIVIMGQQIAADHELFSGVSAGAATKAVDLSFDSQSDETGALDMDLAEDSIDDASDVIDLGAESGELPSVETDDVVSEETGQMRIADAGNDIDFSFDEPELEASATREMPEAEISAEGDETADTPILDDSPQDDAAESLASSGTVESPTIEQQFETFDATGELPVIADPDEAAPASEQTAEINLDDLGLDLDSLSDPSVAEAINDDDDTSISQVLDVVDEFETTGTDIADLEQTGENPALDMPAETAQTGVHKSPDIDSTGLQNALPDLDEVEDTDVGLDTSLLDATGQTQVLTEDMIVQTGTDVGDSLSDDDKTMLAPGLADDSAVEDLAADAATMLAPLDDDEEEGDFDFAKTEALPKDSFSSDMSEGMSLDDTGKMQSLTGSTDMDLDLDDLTAALKVSEVGDTINQARDDATVEQPRLKPEEVDLDVGMMVDDGSEGGTTQALAPDDLSGDLHDARTMTEVGTKLDLARAYVDMGDPSGARSILEEVLDEGDEGQRQQAQKLLGSLPS